MTWYIRPEGYGYTEEELERIFPIQSSEPKRTSPVVIKKIENENVDKNRVASSSKVKW